MNITSVRSSQLSSSAFTINGEILTIYSGFENKRSLNRLSRNLSLTNGKYFNIIFSKSRW